MPSSQRIHGRKKHCFWEVSREGGRVLPGGAPLPIDQSTNSRKNFQEFCESEKLPAVRLKAVSRPNRNLSDRCIEEVVRCDLGSAMARPAGDPTDVTKKA
jgi:hypothetical protein